MVVKAGLKSLQTNYSQVSSVRGNERTPPGGGDAYNTESLRTHIDHDTINRGEQSPIQVDNCLKLKTPNV